MNIKNLSSHKKPEPESSVLYIVGTPIGNLNDLSFRALNILKNVSLIACEDTRQTKKIMNKFEFTNNLISFNKHNSLSKIPRIINDLNLGIFHILGRVYKLFCDKFISFKFLNISIPSVDVIEFLDKFISFIQFKK